MIDGLKNLKYALLQQENDPLEFCVITLPIPSRIGIPFFPCELPNNFKLLQSNEEFSQIGMKIMDLEEESGCLERSFCYPSLRSFRMTSRDFNNNIPIQAERPLKVPLLKKFRPTINVRYDGKPAGYIIEPFVWNFCQCQFHELEIYDANHDLRYKLRAKLNQKGIALFLPFQQCSTIRYEIYEMHPCDMDEELQPLNQCNSVCGSIDHIFYGWDNEFCSKADQYGITFPDDASEQDKALIVMAAVFIDYLWFENF